MHRVRSVTALRELLCVQLNESNCWVILVKMEIEFSILTQRFEGIYWRDVFVRWHGKLVRALCLSALQQGTIRESHSLPTWLCNFVCEFALPRARCNVGERRGRRGLFMLKKYGRFRRNTIHDVLDCFIGISCCTWSSRYSFVAQTGMILSLNANRYLSVVFVRTFIMISLISPTPRYRPHFVCIKLDIPVPASFRIKVPVIAQCCLPWITATRRDSHLRFTLQYAYA